MRLTGRRIGQLRLIRQPGLIHSGRRHDRRKSGRSGLLALRERSGRLRATARRIPRPHHPHAVEVTVGAGNCLCDTVGHNRRVVIKQNWHSPLLLFAFQEELRLLATDLDVVGVDAAQAADDGRVGGRGCKSAFRFEP